MVREQRRQQTIVSIIAGAQALLLKSGIEDKIDQDQLLELVDEDWAAHFVDENSTCRCYTRH